MYFGEIEQFIAEKTVFKAIAKYPSVERDLALLADNEITNAEIIDCIKTSNVKNMESVELFDVYTGSNLPAGKKSMAYSLSFRDKERTLTDNEVNAAMDKVRSRLAAELNVELR